MTATLILTHPAVPATVAAPVLVAASEPLTVEAARRALVLTPANTAAKDAAWADLYLAVVGPPPPGSEPLPEVTA